MIREEDGGVVEQRGALAHHVADHPIDPIFMKAAVEIAMIGERHLRASRSGKEAPGMALTSMPLCRV